MTGTTSEDAMLVLNCKVADDYLKYELVYLRKSFN